MPITSPSDALPDEKKEVMQQPLIKIAAVSLLCLLGACASKTSTRTTEAAASPLFDLNIVRAKIPEVLLEARKNPYLLPPDIGCGALSVQIHRLDAVLGADVDAPDTGDAPSLIERGSDAAEDTAIGMVKRTAEGLVPFRGWVRKLSGAERNSKRVAAAITAGSIRRAFLKGIAASQGCTWGQQQAAPDDADVDAAASPASAAASPPSAPDAPAQPAVAGAPAAPPVPPAPASAPQ